MAAAAEILAEKNARLLSARRHNDAVLTAAEARGAAMVQAEQRVAAEATKREAVRRDEGLDPSVLGGLSTVKEKPDQDDGLNPADYF